MRIILVFLLLSLGHAFSQDSIQEISTQERNSLYAYGPVVVRQLTVNITIDTNGYFDVEENYEVYFNSNRRGILRYLKLKYFLDILYIPELGQEQSTTEYLGDLFFPAERNRRIKISNIDVPDRTFQVSGNHALSSELEIKIGDPDIYLWNRQDYTIKYRVENAFLFRDSIVDFYWNFLGGNWDMSFLNLDFNLFLQGGVDLDSNHYYLYGGKKGSTEELPGLTYENDTLSGKSPFELAPYDDLTLLLHLPEDYVPRPTKSDIFWQQYAWPIYPLGCLFLFLLSWWLIGKDKKLVKQVQYRAPAGIDPAMAGFLIDSKSNNYDLISLLPYWASLGIISMKERKKATKLTPPWRWAVFIFFTLLIITVLSLFTFVIFTQEVDETVISTLVIFSLIGTPHLYRALKKLKTSPLDLNLSKLKELPAKTQKYERTMFNGIFKGGRKNVMVSSLKEKFYKDLIKAKKELKTAGLAHGYTRNSERNVKITKVLTLIAMVLGVIGLTLFYHILAAIVHVIICFILYRKARVMDKRISQGDQTLQDVIGFRMFIEKAEQPKLEFLLKENPKYFEETIAYAVAFGMANEWCKKFNGLAAVPEWYGSRDENNMNFDNFESSFASVVKSATVTMSVSPPSSGSGGSYGGGSSGGGFGGGGGSSW